MGCADEYKSFANDILNIENGFKNCADGLEDVAGGLIPCPSPKEKGETADDN